MLRSKATLLLVLLVGAATQAQSVPVAWERDLDEALAKAKEQSKPVLVTMHTSTEKACIRMLTKVYRDPKVQEALKAFVVLPTCFDRHKEVTVEVDGRSEKVSKLFGGVGCDVLQHNEQTVRDRFFSGNEVRVPHHLVLDGEGEVVLTKVFELKKSAFLGFLDRALVMFGAKATSGLEPTTRAYFKAIREGSAQERAEAVKAILDLRDERTAELLYLAIRGLSKEEDQAACIRAMGYEEYAHAAGLAIRWLDDASTYIRNCAVVTLEEMKSGDAVEPLLALFPRARDGELEKDILRALGPCGAGEPKVKELLLKSAADRDEKLRAASYLSLGHFADEEEVGEFLTKRFEKEGKNVALKTAIVWGIASSRDSGLVPVIEKMVANERNHQLKFVAENAIKTLRGQPPGGGRQFRRSLAPLYARDKIVRNRIRDWRNRGGGRGGR